MVGGNQIDRIMAAHQSGRPEFCILCELRSTALVVARHWLAFDIESAICAALADEVWCANSASDRGGGYRRS